MPSLRTSGSVEVLNGPAKVGDLVAYATKYGNGAELVMGVVIGFEERNAGYWQPSKTVVRLKVKVLKRSESEMIRAQVAGIEKLNRVVVIREAASVSD